jgi:ParB/RepB/Spo0J family partition protein
METIELSQLDCRLEKSRCRDAAFERALLESISQRGILDPLLVVSCDETGMHTLVDGFKRYRCAKKLGMAMIPAQCMAGDIVTAILTLIRRSDCGNSLSTLEQAALIEELHQKCGQTIYDIATQLGRSPSWVSMRLGMLEQLSPLVREKIMTGAFPIRAYMYAIKGFTRVNNIPSQQVDLFVNAVSGKSLSTRELFVLCRSFFNGGPSMQDLILRGDIHRAVQMYTGSAAEDSALSADEQSFVADLQRANSSIERLIYWAGNLRYESGYFAQYVSFLAAKIGKRLTEFSALIGELYDRCRPPVGGADIIPAGSEQKENSAGSSL